MRLHEIVLMCAVLTTYALSGPVLVEVIRTNLIGAVNKTNRQLFLVIMVGVAIVAYLVTTVVADELAPDQKQAMGIPARKASDQQVQMVSASSAVIEVTLVTGQTKRVDAKDLQWLLRNDRLASIRVLGVIEDVGK